MQVMTCTVRRQELNVSAPSLVALSYDYINVTANFSTEWDDITQKWFHCRSVSNPSLRGDVLFDENDTIGEGEGLNLTSGDWEIWIHGSTYDGDTLVKRITTNVKVIHVSATGDEDSVLPDVVGPSVAEQAVAAMEQAEGYAEDAEDSAEESEAWAVGTKDGTPVVEGDDQYNNHSKYWAGVSESEAQTAQTLANAAQNYSKDSEAWAKGTRGGTPVTSGQDGYHDNAKYYADQAEEYKDDASGYATDAYNSEVAAEGYADDASGYADDAEDSAEAAETFAQESEAWAVGKVDGVDVPDTADQYHNNSKYWSEQSKSRAAELINKYIIDEFENNDHYLHNYIRLNTTYGEMTSSFQTAALGRFGNLVYYDNTSSLGQYGGNLRLGLSGGFRDFMSSKPNRHDRPEWFTEIGGSIPDFIVGHKYKINIKLVHGSTYGNDQGEPTLTVSLRFITDTGNASAGTATESTYAYTDGTVLNYSSTASYYPIQCVCLNFGLTGASSSGKRMFFDDCLYYVSIVDITEQDTRVGNELKTSSLYEANTNFDGEYVYNGSISAEPTAEISLNLTPGYYKVYHGELVSTDTDNVESLMVFATAEESGYNNQYLYLNRYEEEQMIILAGNCNAFRLYAGKGSSPSAGDTLSCSDFRIIKYNDRIGKQKYKEWLNFDYLTVPKNPYFFGIMDKDKDGTYITQVKQALSTTHVHVEGQEQLERLAAIYDHACISNYWPSEISYPLEAFINENSASTYRPRFTSIPEGFISSPNAEYLKFRDGFVNHMILPRFSGNLGSVHFNGIGSMYANDCSNNTMKHNECFELIVRNLQFPNAGGVCINHPNYSGLSGDDIIDIVTRCGGIFAMEVYHAGSNGSAGISTTQWDAVLSTGRQIFGLAVPDHFCVDNGKTEYDYNTGCGYNHMLVRAKTEQQIMQAYANGRYYFSNFVSHNPSYPSLKFTRLKWYGDPESIYVRCNKACTITFITSRGVVSTVNYTDTTKDATYTPIMTGNDKDIYVRVEATCEEDIVLYGAPDNTTLSTVNTRLWTNAVML